MAIWSSAFLHQFLDGNPANLNAVQGELTVLPDGLIIRPTPPSDQLGFPIRPGHRLDYAFARPFEEVVGVDIQLNLFFPAGSANDQLSGEVTLADGNTVRLITDFAPGTDPVARLQLHVSGAQMATSVPIAAVGAMSVQARWHTYGQGHIWLNGTLRAYEPSLAAGASLALDRLSLRHPVTDVVPGAPGFLARRLCVKLLRRQDPARFLDKLHPIADSVPLDPDCARQIAEINRVGLSEIRQFMTTAFSRLTTAWREGQPDGPFSPEAITAHDAAVAAGRKYVEFMLHHRDADADQLLDRIGTFLELIESTDPVGYQQLIERLSQISNRLEPRCRDALEPFAQPHAATLAPVAALIQAIWAKVQSPGGANG